MKKKYLYLLPLILLIALPACTEKPEEVTTPATTEDITETSPLVYTEIEADKLVSETVYDFDKDGNKEKLQVYLLDGKKYEDTNTSCASGEIWEGKFNIRIVRDKELLSVTSLNDIYYSDVDIENNTMFFWTPKFVVTPTDYNGDGQIDFNLGQYGSCNGNSYKLFTVSSDNKIDLMPIKDRESIFVSPLVKKNTTSKITAKNNIIQHTYYDNSQGKNITARYEWKDSQFILINE